MADAPRYPHVVVPLVGHDGNAFAILATVKRALSASEGVDVANEYQKAATAGDYDHLLATTMAWVTVE